MQETADYMYPTPVVQMKSWTWRDRVDSIAIMIDLPVPSLRRRLAAMLYESILLAALFLVAGFLVVGLTGTVDTLLERLFYQGYLLLCAGAYLVLSWRWGGQTLAMKTWHIRLVDQAGQRPGLGRCLARYLLAVAGLLLGGVGILWALWDRDRQFLHDRLAGTRLVRSGPLRTPQGDQCAEGEQA